MLRIAIVDDEPDARAYLNRIIRQWTEAEVVGEADSIRTAVEMLQNTAIDILLLDIELPDGLSFEILHRIPVPDFQVIFVTAYDHYALKAFDYAAVGYLLKPVKPEDLVKHIQRTLSGGNRISGEQLRTILKQVAPKKQPDTLILHADDAVHFVKVDTIVRCEAADNYTTFTLFTDQGKFRRLTIAKTIKHYEELLPAEQFMRIHKSHLINLGRIQKYMKADGGYVVMSDNERIIVSRRRKKEFLDMLARLHSH